MTWDALLLAMIGLVAVFVVVAIASVLWPAAIDVYRVLGLI